jgi:hypothetical protein
MLIERVFAVGVNISDPINYAANPKKELEAHLTQKYVGTCYQGVWISRLVAIERYSSCEIMTTNLTAEGTVNVTFKVEVSSMGRGDIVTGVHLMRRPDAVIGLSKTEGNAAVVLNRSAVLDVVRSEDVVAVRIDNITYPPQKEGYEVLGSVLVCDATAPTFVVGAGTVGPDDYQLLAPLVRWIRGLLEERAGIPAESVDFFEGLLYSYKKTGGGRESLSKGWEGPKLLAPPAGFTRMDLLDIVGKCEKGPVDMKGMWRRDLGTPRSAPIGSRAAAPAELPEGAVPATAFQVLYPMLRSVYVFLKAVNEMAREFSDPAKREAQGHIWKAMRSAQRTHN